MFWTIFFHNITQLRSRYSIHRSYSHYTGASRSLLELSMLLGLSIFSAVFLLQMLMSPYPSSVRGKHSDCKEYHAFKKQRNKSVTDRSGHQVAGSSASSGKPKLFFEISCHPFAYQILEGYCRQENGKRNTSVWFSKS